MRRFDSLSAEARRKVSGTVFAGFEYRLMVFWASIVNGTGHLFLTGCPESLERRKK